MTLRLYTLRELGGGLFLLVPTRQRGNAVWTRQRPFPATLVRGPQHSHAGAWEREIDTTEVARDTPLLAKEGLGVVYLGPTLQLKPPTATQHIPRIIFTGGICIHILTCFNCLQRISGSPVISR